MKLNILLAIVFTTFGSLIGQTLEGDRWVDNHLTFKIEYDAIRKNGELFYCIEDTSRGVCIQNLRSGFTLKVYNRDNEMLWEGHGSGRRKGVKLPQALPEAHYLQMKAFKPWVNNSITGERIYQDEPIEIKHFIK